MKKNILTPVILLILNAIICLSCKTNHLPKVGNPTYQFYDNSGERGYIVEFRVCCKSTKPTSVIINKIEQKIMPENKNGLRYKVNVIAQSKKIFGFKPKITELENGIFFKTDTANVFKAVAFKLK